MNNIKLYRVVLNILFYVFYTLLVSIAFSFIFPTILVILGQDILEPSNPIFDGIQIAIIVIVFVISLIFRKYFYLPIKDKSDIVVNKNNVTSFKNKEDTIKKEESLSEELELDIKIGKEIK